MCVSRWLLGLSVVTTYVVMKWLFMDSGNPSKNASIQQDASTDATMPSIISNSADSLLDSSLLATDSSRPQNEVTPGQISSLLKPTDKLNLEPSAGVLCSQKNSWLKEADKFVSTLISIDCRLLESDNRRDANHLIKEAIKSHYQDATLNHEASQSLPLNFSSLKQYETIFAQLLVYETWAMLVQEYQEQTSKFYSFSLESYNDTSIFCQATNTGISENQFTNHILIIGSQNTSCLCLGYVQKQNRRQRAGKLVIKLQIQVSPCSLAKLEEERVVSIRAVFNLKPTLRLIETMSSLSLRPALRDAILIPELTVCLPNIRENDGFRFIEKSCYNKMQQAAIVASFNVISAKDTRFLLLQGPPGTGKTHTLLGIIKHLWVNLSTPPRIMICAPSNGAIDEIGKRLLHEASRLESPLRNATMVRLGQSDKMNPKLQRFLLKEQIERMVSQGHLSSNNSRYKIGEDLIRKANIILTTLASSQSAIGMKIFANGDVRIDCLIVDEAGQAIEPELLMPLIYPSISKIILIGDHLQLPATVISHRAQQLGFGRSLFERFFRYFCQCSNFPVITLKEQFRMHEEICHFPSSQFYGSELVAALGVGVNPAISTKPYYVINITDSQEDFFDFEDNPRRVSKWNKLEVDLIDAMLSELFLKLELSEISSRRAMPISVGVITFYQGQRQAIKHKLAEWKDLVTVDTVDGYQGQERDIIILSCVRASDSTSEDSIGFARSAQRMNVALTRAKSTLVVVLSKSSFERNQTWARLIQDAIDRKRVFKVDATFSRTQLQNILDS